MIIVDKNGSLHPFDRFVSAAGQLFPDFSGLVIAS
jgi:hypothetical protein